MYTQRLSLSISKGFLFVICSLYFLLQVFAFISGHYNLGALKHQSGIFSLYLRLSFLVPISEFLLSLFDLEVVHPVHYFSDFNSPNFWCYYQAIALINNFIILVDIPCLVATFKNP